ncbi:MAG: glycosyltransferase [Prevotella sp.]|jgi:hypothetical protein|nr:glycosyltransferase [Prevotella sp.]
MRKVLIILSPQALTLAPYVNMLMNGISALNATAGERGFQMMMADEAEGIQQQCEALQPDIIHLHGFGSAKANKAVVWAQKQGYRIIITPHGELESWSKDSEAIGSHMRTIISHAYALVARSEIEAAELRNLDLNPRIEIIHNPFITKTTSADRMTREYFAVYEKALNSNVLELFNDETRTVIKTFLKAGITGDERWVTPCEMNGVDWGLLSTYAEQEGITAFCERGMLTLGLTGLLQPAAPSYLPNHYEKPESIAGKTINDMVHIIRNQVSTNNLPLLSLANLDVALRHEDVEDDVVMQQLETEHLTDFMASLLTVIAEQTGLDEGFMPCAPKEDNTTRQIRSSIVCHLQI